MVFVVNLRDDKNITNESCVFDNVEIYAEIEYFSSFFD